MKHGEINTGTDVHGKAVRVGSVTVTALELTKAVTFDTAIPSVNYQLFFQPQGNLSAILWATDLTVDGFTLNLSVGIAGSISYVAVEN